jgi:hypothetical protein
MEIRQAQHDTIPASRNKGQGQAHHDTTIIVCYR